jgi:hypothetical protein
MSVATIALSRDQMSPEQIASKHLSSVMAGLVPAIHVLLSGHSRKGVDARDERGHDGGVMTW